MTCTAPISETMSLHVPFRIVKRGGRKEVQLPEGTAQPRKPDNTLVKALARAFRWKRMLESGEFGTISELAEREGIAPSYVARLLQLTTLAPDIVNAILDGSQHRQMTSEVIRCNSTSDWAEQQKMLNPRVEGKLSDK